MKLLEYSDPTDLGLLIALSLGPPGARGEAGPLSGALDLFGTLPFTRGFFVLFRVI